MKNAHHLVKWCAFFVFYLPTISLLKIRMMAIYTTIFKLLYLKPQWNFKYDKYYKKYAPAQEKTRGIREHNIY